MRSTHKPLGEFIEEINSRDSTVSIDRLLGVSIQKKFIPSIANTIGTDMSTYKIINKNQFAYGPVTSRNGNRISIALLEEFDEAIVSQAYTVFQIKDSNLLTPQYLNMWFKRSEFDRYARFMSHGSAREIFGWEEMCNTLLPIPSLEKQKSIVSEYLVVLSQKTTNQKIITKIEESIQAVYRQWFKEFDFPNQSGQPYKSSGGTMKYEDTIESEIPESWTLGQLSDIYTFQYGKGNTNPDNGGQYPIYGSNGVIGGFNKFNNEDTPVIGHIGTAGSLVFAHGKHYVTYNGVMCKVKNPKHLYYGYCCLVSKNLTEQVRGSSQPFVSYDMLYEIPNVTPPDDVAASFETIAKKMFQIIKIKLKENEKLQELENILLSRLATI